MLKNNLFFLVLIYLCFGCDCSKQDRKPVSLINHDLLKSGDIICRLGDGYFSGVFQKYASSEKKFSHLGILYKKKDSVYVYHSEASELTGVGKVKKEAITSFLDGINVYKFYRMNYPDSLTKKIVAKAESYFSKQTPFDLEFDSFNDDKLYCTELIAMSINSAFTDTIIRPSLNLNGRLLFTLDDIYLHQGTSLIHHEKIVSH